MHKGGCRKKQYREIHTKWGLQPGHCTERPAQQPCKTCCRQDTIQRELHREAAQTRCSKRLHKEAAQSGCTKRLHKGAAQKECSKRLHKGAAQRGCTTRLHKQAAQRRLHVKVRACTEEAAQRAAESSCNKGHTQMGCSKGSLFVRALFALVLVLLFPGFLLLLGSGLLCFFLLHPSSLLLQTTRSNLCVVTAQCSKYRNS